MRYEDSRGQIEKYARKVVVRCRAAGAHTVQFEDICSECAIAWMKARDTFDPEAGASFKTYLTKGMELHMHGYLRREIPRSQAAINSLDAPAFEGETSEIHEAVADERIVSAEDAIIRSQRRREMMGRLSKTARRVIALLEDPPAELMAEFSAIRDRGRYARDRGMTSRSPKDLNLETLFTLCGIGRQKATVIRQEFADLTRYASSSQG